LPPVEFRIDKKMAVNIKGNFYARMPELVLNILYVLPGGDSDAGIRVP